MIVVNKKHYLEQLEIETVLSILSSKGSIYKYYLNKQEREEKNNG